MRDIEKNAGPPIVKTTDIASLTVEWDDGRTSRLSPRTTTATETYVGDSITILWGKKKTTGCTPRTTRGCDKKPVHNLSYHHQGQHNATEM